MCTYHNNHADVLCVNLLSHLINRILKEQKERKTRKWPHPPFKSLLCNTTSAWGWCISWCSRKSCMNKNCHKCTKCDIYIHKYLLNYMWHPCTIQDFAGFTQYQLFKDKMMFEIFIFLFDSVIIAAESISAEFQGLIFTLYRWWTRIKVIYFRFLCKYDNLLNCHHWSSQKKCIFVA